MLRDKQALTLDSAVRVAHAAWPRLNIDLPAFRAALIARAKSSSAALKQAPDLYLAFACAAGSRGAAQELDALLAAELPRALARFGQPASFVDDVRQELLQRLLLGEHPRVRTYQGRGPLRPWLCAAAIRVAINLLEKERSAGRLSSPLPMRSADDPELVHLRHRYAPALKSAVESALRALSVGERTALRFYFLEGLTVEQIANVRGINKSNVSRLIARIRKSVFQQVRERMAKVGVAGRELDSILRLVKSDVHLSLERALDSQS